MLIFFVGWVVETHPTCLGLVLLVEETWFWVPQGTKDQPYAFFISHIQKDYFILLPRNTIGFGGTFGATLGVATEGLAGILIGGGGGALVGP